MSSETAPLPLTETLVPPGQAELLTAVRGAIGDRLPIYPIGGGTSLDYGVRPRRPGVGISLAGVDRVVDYPARDMTITVDAGMPLARLAATLAGERQRLPIDFAGGDRATIGGLLATNASGPRRYGCGTLRDYVIGIQAIDGRGTAFKAGGRVVKNVAGYDLCKLLVGSLGTLAIVTQVTLKVTPIPAASVLVTAEIDDFAAAETALAGLVNSRTTPTAIELVYGPAWSELPALVGPANKPRLVVACEGTVPEVAWMTEQLSAELRALGLAPSVIADEHAGELWSRLSGFAADRAAEIVVKLNVRPSRVCDMMRNLGELDHRCSLQAHAGSGIVLARFGALAPAEVARELVRRIQPAAVAAGGHAVVWSYSGSEDLTRQVVWGPPRADSAQMRAVRQQFDPRELLNPGRFVYGDA